MVSRFKTNLKLAIISEKLDLQVRPLPPLPPPQQQLLSHITALATPSPLSSAGSNEESEPALSVNNTAANDLCDDDDDPGM